MAAYFVARVDVQNWNAYREYMRHTPRVIQQHGGRFIARGGSMVTLEGPQENLRVVLIEFPTLEHARAFYNSPEYQAVKKLRDGSGTAQFIVIDGYPAEEWDAAVRESAKLPPPG